MAVDPLDIQFYRLEKIDECDIEGLQANGANIAFRVEGYGSLNMKKILSFLEENKQLKIQVDRLKDSMMSLTEELSTEYKGRTQTKYI